MRLCVCVVHWLLLCISLCGQGSACSVRLAPCIVLCAWMMNVCMYASYHQHPSVWFTPSVMELGSLAPRGTEKRSDLLRYTCSQTWIFMRIHQQTKDTNYNIVQTQQCRFAFPAAILILEISCLTSLESGSILLLLIINIYERVNRPRKLFLTIVWETIIWLHSYMVACVPIWHPQSGSLSPRRFRLQHLVFARDETLPGGIYSMFPSALTF